MEPGRWYYGLAALIAAAGIALFATSIVSSIGSIGADFQQVVVPGSGELFLAEAGEYTIFYENRTVANGAVYVTGDDISGLVVEVKNATTGQEIEIYSPGSMMSYSIGSRSGRSLLAFDIDQPGIYRLSAAYAQGKQGPEVVLAVGPGISGDIVSGVLLPMLLFFGSIALAAAVAVITYQKRREAAKRAAEEERRIKGL